MIRALLYVVIVSLCVGWCTHEYIRYESARDVAFQQQEDYRYVLAHTACRDHDHVRTIEYKGALLDCATLRLALLRPLWKQSFLLWWQTSVWVTNFNNVTQNPWMVLSITLVTIVTCIWIGFQSCVQTRLNDQMVRQYERLVAPPSPPPIPQVEYMVQPARRGKTLQMAHSRYK